MKVRVIYNPDKTVSVIHPAPKSRRITETETEWLERVFSKATPKGAEYDDIEASELPQTREDRGAWEGERGKGISVNTAKAQIQRENKAQEIKIQAEMKNITRQMAIDSLTTKKANISNE